MSPETQIVLQTLMDGWMICTSTFIFCCAIQFYQDIKGEK